MTKLRDTTFVCVDCETTGLDPKNDHIIEIAAVRFSFQKELSRYHTLVNPKCTIPETAIEIHHITQDMVANAPTIDSVLPKLLQFVDDSIIVGHAIPFDLSIINAEAKRHNTTTHPLSNQYIDTLRLARHYGESPNNSLDVLRRHFNIPELGAHRALNDVLITIDVFKHLCSRYKTLQDIFSILAKPIPMKRMPLGKYKGRPFSEVPLPYLKWASYQNFDRDLLFSIKREIKIRKNGNTFSQASNPFSSL